MSDSFVDSNVLLYVTSSDASKVACAEQLLQRRLIVSVQVLNEIVNVARKKFRRSWPEINDLVDRLRPLLEVHALTEAMHHDARRVVDRYGLQWWDALLVAAALTLGCDTFYSEDMHAGLLIDSRLRIVNPFA